MSKPRLRADVYVDGKLVASDWLEEETAEPFGIKHMSAALTADLAGKNWMVQIVDPDGDLPPIRLWSERSDQ